MRDKQLARIFACRKQVDGLADDDAWRDFLEQQTGKRSLKVMTGREKGKVVDALHANGAPKAGHKVAPRRAKSGRLSTAPLAGKARALWLSLYALGEVSDPSEAGLRGFCKRQTGVDDPGFLAPEQGHQLIEALKARLQRAGVHAPTPTQIGRHAERRFAAGFEKTPAGHLEKVRVVERLLMLLIDDDVRLLRPGVPVGAFSATELDREIERLGALVRAKQVEK